MAVNEKLAKFRKSKNLTQKEVAARLNIAVSTFSNYERGTRIPSPELIHSFAKVLNLSDDEKLELMFDRDVNDAVETYATKPFDRQSFVILDPEKLKELSYADLSKIKEYAEMIYQLHYYNQKPRIKRHSKK